MILLLEPQIVIEVNIAYLYAFPLQNTDINKSLCSRSFTSGTIHMIRSAYVEVVAYLIIISIYILIIDDIAVCIICFLGLIEVNLTQLKRQALDLIELVCVSAEALLPICIINEGQARSCSALG